MFLRTLWTMQSHRVRGHAGFADTTTLRGRVWPQDLDLNFHMNNGRYFSVADVGRIDWWLRTGLWARISERRWRPVAGDSTARFSRSLQPLQRYELNTRLLGWDCKWLFSEHRFISGGAVCATVLCRYLFLAPDGEPRPTPGQALELIGVREASPELPDWVGQWSAAQDRLSASLKRSASVAAMAGTS